MNGCFDMNCEKCGERVSWIGDHTMRPACPSCGSKGSPGTVQALDDLANCVNKIMAFDAAIADGPTLKWAREYAGLTRKQAGKLLGQSDTYMAMYEADIYRPGPIVAARMNEAYKGKKAVDSL